MVCLLDDIFWKTSESGSAAFANSIIGAQCENGNLYCPITNAHFRGAKWISFWVPRNLLISCCPTVTEVLCLWMISVFLDWLMVSNSGCCRFTCFVAVSFLSCILAPHSMQHIWLSSHLVTRNWFSHFVWNLYFLLLGVDVGLLVALATEGTFFFGGDTDRIGGFRTATVGELLLMMSFSSDRVLFCGVSGSLPSDSS